MKTIIHRSEHLNKLQAEYIFFKSQTNVKHYVQRTKIRMRENFSLETRQARRIWYNIFKLLKESCHAKMLYSK